MDKKIALSVLGFALLAIAILFVIPTGKQPEKVRLLPWNVEILPNGATKVLGITLGQSTMEDARQIYQNDWEVNLFVSPDNKITVEGYFNRIFISGLKADLVMSLSLDKKTLSEMYQRGARISQLGNGTKKVNVSSADTNTITNAVIKRITYLPTANLDGELIENLFGKPDSIIKEESGIEHWLYPKIGLDIALNPDGKEIFQYVIPATFDEVMKPLMELKKAKAKG